MTFTRTTAAACAWGQTLNTDTVNGVGSGSVATLTIYGRIPAQVSQPPGVYTDTVQVTLTY